MAKKRKTNPISNEIAQLQSYIGGRLNSPSWQKAYGGGSGGGSTAPESLTLTLPEMVYSQAELDEAIDRDRITGFMLFVRNLPDSPASLVYGTSLQAKAIMRALAKAGY